MNFKVILFLISLIGAHHGAYGNAAENAQEKSHPDWISRKTFIHRIHLLVDPLYRKEVVEKFHRRGEFLRPADKEWSAKIFSRLNLILGYGDSMNLSAIEKVKENLSYQMLNLTQRLEKLEKENPKTSILKERKKTLEKLINQVSVYIEAQLLEKI